MSDRNRPGARPHGLALRTSYNSSALDAEPMFLGGTGAPSSGTYGGKTLASTQAGVLVRGDAPTPADMLTLTQDGGTTLEKVVIDPGPSRYSLEYQAGEDGLIALSASAAYIVSRYFEILGTNASDDDVTYNAEGGLTLETDGGSGDQVIVLPHLTAGLSPWTATTWGTDKETHWECVITLGSDITAMTVWAGLKLTNTSVTATDADQAFIRYQDTVAAGNFQAVSSIGGTDTETDSGVAAAADTRYVLRIVILADRTAKFYIDDTLVETTAALTNTIDLIPYIGVQDDGAAARSIVFHSQKISRNVG